MARGGKIPGWGGGDTVRALLEKGEFVVRKEAVKRYGAGLFEALNRMTLKIPPISLPSIPRLEPAFATGGLVGGGDLPSLGFLTINVGSERADIVTDPDGARGIERVLRYIEKTRI